MIALLCAALSLTVTAEPALLRLGLDARATVRIAAREEPRVSASAGRLENLRRAGDGVFEADYLPPDDGLPQVALVAAVADGLAGSVAIPLWGQGDARVKTRRRAAITVQIGEATFGPVTADANGEALVAVRVPPGVASARHGQEEIDLHVPPARTLHAIAGRAQVLADRDEEVELFAFAVTAAGLPRADARPVARVDRGALGPFEPRAPGLYAARWTLPAGAEGEARAVVALADAPAFETGLVVQRLAGPARTIALSAERERLVAGEGGAVLHASARDGAGNPAREELRFSTSFGALQAQPAGPGAWTLALAVPDAHAGLSSLTVTASGAGASAAATLTLAPAAPAQATLAGAQPIHADGRSPLRLALELRDRFGNRIVDARPVASAERGAAAVGRQGDAFLATYVPPLLRERSSALVSIRAGEVQANARVELLPQVALVAVSPKLGALSNFSGLSSPLVGLEAALRWDSLAVGLEAAYAFLSRTESVTAPGAAAPVSARSRTDAALLWAPVSLRKAVGERSLVWLSAGPTLTAMWTRAGVNGALGPTSTALAPGAQLAVGGERRFRRVVPFLELRYGVTRDPRLAQLAGSLRPFSLAAGVRLELL